MPGTVIKRRQVTLALARAAMIRSSSQLADRSAQRWSPMVAVGVRDPGHQASSRVAPRMRDWRSSAAGILHPAGSTRWCCEYQVIGAEAALARSVGHDHAELPRAIQHHRVRMRRLSVLLRARHLAKYWRQRGRRTHPPVGPRCGRHEVRPRHGAAAFRGRSSEPRRGRRPVSRTHLRQIKVKFKLTPG